MTLGAFVSSGSAGFMAIKLGRKSCLWIGCLLCFVSNIIMMTTEDIETLYGGRFLNGLANGCFMTFSQLYIQEGSPAKYRGLFLTAFQFCISIVSTIKSGAPNIAAKYANTDRLYRVLLSAQLWIGQQV